MSAQSPLKRNLSASVYNCGWSVPESGDKRNGVFWSQTQSKSGSSKRAKLVRMNSWIQERERRESHVIQFHNVRILKDGKIVNEDLWIQNGKIIDARQRFWEAKSRAADRKIDCCNMIIAPGFIDLQMYGGYGVDFSSLHTLKSGAIEAAIQSVAQKVVQHGVTLFTPSIISSSNKVYHKAVPHIKKKKGTHKAAGVLGTHLEGPFIEEKQTGAHNVQHIQTPSNGFKSCEQVYGSLNDVAIVTLAPELEGGLAAIKGLKSKGVVTAIGHSIASLSQAEASLDEGCRLVTHLFNGMPAFHHRDPGPIGLLGGSRAFYTMIVDGIHAHRASVKIAHNANPGGMVVVTGATAGMSAEAGDRLTLGDAELEMIDGSACVKETKKLAGGILPMDACVRNLMEFTGCDKAAALEAASLHPAQVMGIEKSKGTLNCGADADLVLLNDELEVMGTFIGGELAWQAQSLHGHLWWN